MALVFHLPQNSMLGFLLSQHVSFKSCAEILMAIHIVKKNIYQLTQLQACEVNEEITEVPESETDQAKLLLELQKENRELRVQLARHQLYQPGFARPKAECLN